MTVERLRLYAAAVRAELIARGTPLDPLGEDEVTVRRQLGTWIPLLRLAPPTEVREGERLVIPVVENEVGRGKRTPDAR